MKYGKGKVKNVKEMNIIQCRKAFLFDYLIQRFILYSFFG